MVMPRLGKPKKEDIDDAVLNSEYDEKRKNYQIRNQLLRKYEAFKQKKVEELFSSLKWRLEHTQKECDISRFNLDYIDAKFSQKVFTINCKMGVVNIQISQTRGDDLGYYIDNHTFYRKKCSKCKKEMCKEEFHRFSELLYLIDKYKEKLKCENCSINEV